MTDSQRGSVRTQKANARRRRKKLQAKLRAEGANEQLIEKIIQQQKPLDLVARNGLERARDLVNTEAHRRDADDKGFKPTATDPLLRGPARVTGVTAKTVRRRNTITRFQYDKEAGRARPPLNTGSRL